MNKKEVDQALKNISEISANLEKLIIGAREKMLDLPSEERKKLEFFEKEFIQAHEGMKKGDFALFEQILKKYAG
jgi:uncharacterized membrane protein